MQPRTESDDHVMAPLQLRLGQKDYLVPLLPNAEAREWRLKLDASLGDIVSSFQPEAKGKLFETGLTGALIQFPDKLAELVFAYANGWVEPDSLSLAKKRLEKPVLPEPEILSSASPKQIAMAFRAMMEEAYPFLPQLAMARQAVLGSLAQKAKSTTLQ